MNGRLYRSRDDRMIAGVAGGLAELWDADPSLVRVVWAVLALLTGGVALLVYIVMAIVVPEEDGESWAGQAIAWTGTTTTGRGAPSGGTPASGSPAPAPPAGADPDATASGGISAAASGPVYPSSVPGVPSPPSGWPQSRADARALRRAARSETRTVRREARGRHGRSGAMIVGLILILIGAWSLVREFLPAIDFDWFWPLVLVGSGILVLVFAVRPGPGGGSEPGAGA